MVTTAIVFTLATTLGSCVSVSKVCISVTFVYLGLININHNNQITIQSQQLVNTIYTEHQPYNNQSSVLYNSDKTTIVCNNISYISKYLKCVEKSCTHIPQFPPSLIVTWRVPFRRSSQSIRITSRDLLSLVACRIILGYRRPGV